MPLVKNVVRKDRIMWEEHELGSLENMGDGRVGNKEKSW
jgi:hypothetical protein